MARRGAAWQGQAWRGGEADVFHLGYAIALLLTCFSSLYTMEVERIWIFMVPFVVIPAAQYLQALCSRRGSLSDFYWVAGLLCTQLILFEVMLDTFW